MNGETMKELLKTLKNAFVNATPAYVEYVEKVGDEEFGRLAVIQEFRGATTRKKHPRTIDALETYAAKHHVKYMNVYSADKTYIIFY